jgi:hypothetical protein
LSQFAWTGKWTNVALRHEAWLGSIDTSSRLGLK